VQMSVRLPTHRVDRGDEFLSPGAIGELASAAEAVGFGAVFTTEHPFPGDHWLAHGGHHALDPLVALSFAAAATSKVRLHTNLFILAYRNPFIAAKGIASLDVLSGGRVTIGTGAGYLEPEFTALGVPFANRGERTDEAIRAMKAAWTGESVVWDGEFFQAPGNTMLPVPLQQPHPVLWIGGNSRRAIRRAVELGDGWCPFPNPPGMAKFTRTAVLQTTSDLARELEYAAEYAESIGRTRPLTIVFAPVGLSDVGTVDQDDGAVIATLEEMARVGVSWVTVGFPGDTRAEQLASIDRFAPIVTAAAAI
jgi:probable F420-dependent oxidoreductase